MTKQLLSTTIMSVLIVLLATTAFAHDGTHNTDLVQRYDQLACKGTYASEQLALLDNLTDEDLSVHALTVQADLDELHRLADAPDREGFHTYLRTIFTPHFKTINDAIHASKKGIRPAMVPMSRRKMSREGFKAAQEKFAECAKSKQEERIEAKISTVQKTVQKWAGISDQMKAKGFDVTSLDAIITEATAQETALETALQATDRESRKTALDAARKAHLHLWARFEIARIELYTQKYTQTKSTTEIQALLDDAKAKVKPGVAYSDGEFEIVKKDLKDAAQKLRALAKESKPSTDASASEENP